MTRVTASKTLKKSKKVMRKKIQDKNLQAGQKKKRVSPQVVPESIEDQDLASSSDSEEIYFSRKKMNSKDELHADVTDYSSDASEEDKAKNSSNAPDKSSGSESEEICNSEKRGLSPKKAKVLKKKINAKKLDYTFNEEKKSIASPKKVSEKSKLFDIDVSPQKTNQKNQTKKSNKVNTNNEIKNQIKELHQTKLKNDLKLTPAETLTKAEKAKMFKKLVIKDGIISTVYEPRLTKEELKKQYEDKVNNKLIKESSTIIASSNGLSKLNQGEAENSPDASEDSEGDDVPNVSVASEDELDVDETSNSTDASEESEGDDDQNVSVASQDELVVDTSEESEGDDDQNVSVAFKDEAQSLSNDAEESSGSESEEIMSEKREHSAIKAKFLKKEIKAEKSGNTFNEEKISVVSPKVGSENSKLFDVDVSPVQTNQSPTNLKDDSKFTPVKTLTKAEKAKMFKKLVIKDGIISTVYEPRLTKEELKKQYEDKVNTKLFEESSTVLASSSGLRDCKQDETEKSSDASEEELDVGVTQNSLDASDKSEEDEARNFPNSHLKNLKKRSNNGDAQCSEDDTESQEPNRKKQKVLTSLNSEEYVKKIEMSESAEEEDLLTQTLTSNIPKNIKNSDNDGKQTRVLSEEHLSFINTICVEKLPVDTTKEALTLLFRQFRPISSWVPENEIPKEKAPKTFKLKSVHGYVVFETEDQVRAALSLNGTEFQDHVIKVSLVKFERNVFVRYLPRGFKELRMFRTFSQFGTISSINVFRDKMGRGRGYASVQFETKTGAENALRRAILIIGKKQVQIVPDAAPVASNENSEETKNFSPKKEDALLNEPKSIEKTIRMRRNSQ